MLFPLPLAPFELMMLLDDTRSDYPMWFEIATDVSGTIDRSEFEEAVRLVQERHPLISSQVVYIKRYPHWIEAKSLAGAVYWALDDIPAVVEEFYRPVSLEETFGLRVLVCKHDELIRIIWRFHHASTDGIGGSVVIGDAFAIYHGLITKTDWQSRLRKLDLERLTQRSTYRPLRVARPLTANAIVTKPPSMNWKARLQLTFKPALEAIHLLTLSPMTIAPGQQIADTNPSKSLFTKKFSGEETVILHELSRSMNVTVNDLLLAGFFRAIFHWNQKRRDRSSGVIRITMPTNLRASEDKKSPAANRMSYAFLDRHTTVLGNWTSLVAGLNYASRAIIRENLSLQFLKTLATFAKWPSLLRLMVLGRGCFSSAVLSNLGDPTRRFEATLPSVDGRIIAGGLTLESFYAAPPIRPKTNIAIAVCHYDECLTFGAMYDRGLFQIADVDELLGQIYDEIVTASTGETKSNTDVR